MRESGPDAAYAKYRKYFKDEGLKLSPLGGFQGWDGQIALIGGYDPGGFLDYVVEGYAGTHDELNSFFSYTSNGLNKHHEGWRKLRASVMNVANVFVATPIAVPSMIPDYMRPLVLSSSASDE